jgi:CrcB protein
MPASATDAAADPDSPPSHLRPAVLGLVLAGGVAGTLVRYGLGLAMPTRHGQWPWSTFTANMVGTVVLGMTMALLAALGSDTGWRLHTRMLVGAGFCGSLTTYSTFALDSDRLLASDRPLLGVGYCVLTILVGLAAAALGWYAGTVGAQRWSRDRAEDETC